MPRKLIASLLGLAGFIAYVVAVVTLADRVTDANVIVQVAFFLVAGVLAGVAWMARDRSPILEHPPEHR